MSKYSNEVNKALEQDDYRTALDQLIERKVRQTMARKNIIGTPFLSLGLEKSEERILKAYLKEKKWSAKRYIRFLVRSDLQIKIKLNGKS